VINVFFNPYTDRSRDVESMKKSLLSTAQAFRVLSKNIAFIANDSQESESIKCYSLAEDKQGVWYNAAHFIKICSAKKEKELVQWFLLQFDKGVRIKNENLSMCEDWILSGIDAPAPILEYALRQDGMAVTISDDQDWRVNFLSFKNQSKNLPNIYGQEDYSLLVEWIKEWLLRNTTFQEFLEKEYGIIFCAGSSNTCFPTRYEAKGVIDSLSRAKGTGYPVDNNIVKIFHSKYGDILELRSYGDGVRLFFVLKDRSPVVGGFYRKSGAMSQDKVGNNAAKRLNDGGYL